MNFMLQERCGRKYDFDQYSTGNVTWTCYIKMKYQTKIRFRNGLFYLYER